MRATAVAHPNIALVKYWGKQDSRRNLPAVGSLSITLDALRTRTRLAFDDRLEADLVVLDGASGGPAGVRVAACLDRFRERTGVRGFARVESESNFPVAAGLASSASGFAALVAAADAAAGTRLDRAALARLAGAASGSAARSLYGGFVRLDRPGAGETDISLTPLAEAQDWPLEVVIAVTDPGPKPVGSTAAMLASEATSPYYGAWVAAQEDDLDEAAAAVAGRDFERLAAVSEYSCLKMHALTLSSRPGILYWKPATLACLHALRELREAGHGTFFTVDAGPQVKAVCLPEAAEAVAATLNAVPGVTGLLRTGLGEAPQIAESG
ncbi:MAG TPA: diphosphomevalonate decarboxylase [Woeseiaceae bacterium]|nr:diphosphomevalonate decarboxylase [Woeseiaceae bacterium]